MRQRAAQHRAVEHPGQLHVVDIGTVPADEPGVLLALHPAEPHRGGCRHGAATSSSVGTGSAAGCSAAQRTAFTMFSYPVQRQDCPEIASRISASEGSGLWSSNQRAVSIMPGVQNPHCSPWHSTKPCCTGSSTPSRSSPSTVRTSCPCAITARTVQDLTGVPSSQTVHTPQLDVSQPQWVPVSPSSSRRKCTSSRRVSA